MFRMIVVCLLCSGLVSVAHAGLLSSLGRLAGDAADAGSAARKADGIGGVDLPDVALRAAKAPDTTPLALGINADGGVRLTDELGRSVDVPVGGDLDAALRVASGGTKKVAVVVDVKTLSTAGDVVFKLAERRALRLWYSKKSYPVQLVDRELAIELHPGVVTSLRVSQALQRSGGRAGLIYMSALREISYALDKTLNRGTVVIAEFGTPAGGPRRVGFRDGPSGKSGETLKVTREDLLSGLKGNRGGTVVLAGRVRDGAVATKAGPVPLTDIRREAAAADVHLLIVDGPAAAAHKALADATTYGDLLTGLAPKEGVSLIDALPLGNNRVRLTVTPSRPLASQDPKAVADDLSTVAEAAVHVGVHGAVRLIEFDTRDRSYEQDLSMRLIPFVPFWAHVLYLLNLVMGLFGGRYAWRLWRRIWPMAPRARRIALGHIPRFVVFLLIFLPLTGFVWAIVAFFASIGNTIMAILRLIGLVPRKPA